MPRTKEQYAQMRSMTKEKITAAGLRLFSHKGLAATSINDIASLAGISTGLLYRHYQSKEELFCELVENAVRENKGVEEILALEISPADIIKRITREVLDALMESDEAAQYLVLMSQSVLAGNMPEKALELRKNDFALFEQTAELIAKGQKLGEIKSGDPLQMATFFYSAIQGLGMYKLVLGDKFVPPSVELVTSFLIKGEP